MFRILSYFMSMIIFLPLIANGYNAGLKTNLVSWWALEDLSDSGPEQNSLANLGTVGFQGGLVANSAHMANKEQNLIYPSFSAPDMFSVAAWYRTTDTSPYQTIILDDSSFGLEIKNGKVSAFIQNGLTTNTFTPSDASIGNSIWTFFVMEWDGANRILSISKNGGPLESSRVSINRDSDVHTLRLGWSPVADIARDVDEVGLWSRLLTQSEISSIYNEGKGITY